MTERALALPSWSILKHSYAVQKHLLTLADFIVLHFQIKRYYAFKVKHKELYDGLVPSHETNIFKHNILTVFPNRDQLGRRILLLELGSK